MQSTDSFFLLFLHAFVHGNVSFITFSLTQRLTSSDKKRFFTKSVNVLSASCYTMMSYLLSETLCGPAWPELVTRVTITCVAWHQVCSASGQASLMGESVGGGKQSISTLDCVCRRAVCQALFDRQPVRVSSGQPGPALQQLSWLLSLEGAAQAHPRMQQEINTDYTTTMRL